ncbi:hypothetical protein BN2476_420006 [Paraburkholderia piptadeniae]|uniref:Uncharacterized protein n=1 Tax=Paraburkholderia piptadeniae TaxID=1701573 RepID=A0A1N7SAQ1_9BURK|nr:hypothetical protein BN2476_420006 [Paraburkholderia piptadeniae]
MTAFGEEAMFICSAPCARNRAANGKWPRTAIAETWCGGKCRVSVKAAICRHNLAKKHRRSVQAANASAGLHVRAPWDKSESGKISGYARSNPVSFSTFRRVSPIRAPGATSGHATLAAP